MVVFGVIVVGWLVELLGIEVQIGLFINILLVIIVLQLQQSVVDYLQGMQVFNLVLCEYEYMFLYDIQCWVGYGGEVLFDSILVFENFFVVEVLCQVFVDLEFFMLSNYEQINYFLMLGVILGECLSLQYVYVWCDFDVVDIVELDCYLLYLLQWMVEIFQVVLGELVLFDVGECQEVLWDWQVLFEVLLWGGVVVVFVYQVVLVFEVIVLVCGDEYFSYVELDMCVECLVCGLWVCGVVVEVLVVIVVECFFDLVVGLLGIFKVGVGYLLLDLNYFVECLVYMLCDSGVCWLICQEILVEWLFCLVEVEWLLLEIVVWLVSVDMWLLLEVVGEMLVYVIYMFGLIGQLKGVVVSQVVFVVYCQVVVWIYGVGFGDC